ncbi:DUF3168 domain-containing protein [Maricaulis maris]|uniref:DUF3168 domain-containing protein n=1 Tax=Maricaulis maris TaxID=74318 RepID=UPI003B8E3152
MSGVVEALQIALATRFAATPALTNVLGDPLRLFEERNRRAAFPHASWGSASVSETGVDTTRLVEIRLTLDVWQRDIAPRAVLAALADTVANAADIDLPAPWRLIHITPAYRDIFIAPERRLKRGLLRVKAVLAQ